MAWWNGRITNPQPTVITAPHWAGRIGAEPGTWTAPDVQLGQMICDAAQSRSGTRRSSRQEQGRRVREPADIIGSRPGGAVGAADLAPGQGRCRRSEVMHCAPAGTDPTDLRRPGHSWPKPEPQDQGRPAAVASLAARSPPSICEIPYYTSTAWPTSSISPRSHLSCAPCLDWSLM